MGSGRRLPTTLTSTVLPLQPEPPFWVNDLLPASSAERIEGRWPIDVVHRSTLARVSTRIPQARNLEPATLSASVREAYAAIGGLLSAVERHPVRFWNFVPEIGGRFGALDRYMVFNQGRFEALALSERLSGRTWSPSTSSAVGIAGDDLVIECLASSTPGIPVENPRQISSWQYSSRFGPRPPCFARATIAAIGGKRWLLIGGTASIVGEESLHQQDGEAQLLETFTNLEALIGTATGRPSLALMTDARIYIAHLEHATAAEAAIRSRLTAAGRIEPVIATICRPELLVEVEGRVLLEG